MDLPKLKTFKADMADAVKKDNISVVKMALAENRRREQTEEVKQQTPTSKKNLFLITSSLILILIGGGALAYFIFFKPEAPSVPLKPSTTTAKGIIFAEQSKVIKVRDFEPQEIFKAVQAEKDAPQTLGTIHQLIFQKEGDTANSQISAKDFLLLIRSHLPASLERSLDDKFFFGIHLFSKSQPIMIFTTQNFQNTYAGMLEWEKNMKLDLGHFFTTSTSTVASSDAFFQDAVIQNKDARVVNDENGNLLFFYTFINNNTLVITDSDATLKEVLARYAKANLLK